MEWIDDGVVVAVRRHGEASILVSLLTRRHGRHAGVVRGGAKGGDSGLLQIGNLVRVRWRARLAEHIGAFSCELIEASAARHIREARELVCLVAACAVTETALPEREPCSRIFDGLTALLLNMVNADAGWGSAYVKWEIDVLSDLGFGLDLSQCAVTGVRDRLKFVSPRTGRAVSEGCAGKYRHRLLPLPSFLLDRNTNGSSREVAQALSLTGHFLERYVYRPYNRRIPEARFRLLNLYQE